MLLAAGANPNVENARDATPAEVAAAHNFTEFAELVRTYSRRTYSILIYLPP